MNSKWAVIITAPLVLAGCSATEDSHQLTPGNWQISVEMADIDVPGATREQLDAFKQAIGTKTSEDQCIQPSEASLSPETISGAFPHGENCSAQNFSFEGGELSGSMVCEVPDGANVSTPITGTVSSEFFSITVPAEMTGGEFPSGSATVIVRVYGAFQGEC